MNKETLMAMGLTEEQANKVMEGLNGNFVPKTRFNEVNTELNKAKATITDRDKQLETLKASNGDVESLKKQITDLQTANADQKKAHDAEMKEFRINSAVEMALTGAKAKNLVAVKALMAEFMKSAEIGDDGTVKGLDAEVKKLVDGKDTAFLFDVDATKKGFKGAKPAEKSDTTPTGMTLEKFRALPPQERYKFSTEHPEEYKSMYENGGN